MSTRVSRSRASIIAPPAAAAVVEPSSASTASSSGRSRPTKRTASPAESKSPVAKKRTTRSVVASSPEPRKTTTKKKGSTRGKSPAPKRGRSPTQADVQSPAKKTKRTTTRRGAPGGASISRSPSRSRSRSRSRSASPAVSSKNKKKSTAAAAAAAAAPARRTTRQSVSRRRSPSPASRSPSRSRSRSHSRSRSRSPSAAALADAKEAAKRLVKSVARKYRSPSRSRSASHSRSRSRSRSPSAKKEKSRASSKKKEKKAPVRKTRRSPSPSASRSPSRSRSRSHSRSRRSRSPSPIARALRDAKKSVRKVASSARQSAADVAADASEVVNTTTQALGQRLRSTVESLAEEEDEDASMSGSEKEEEEEEEEEEASPPQKNGRSPSRSSSRSRSSRSSSPEYVEKPASPPLAPRFSASPDDGGLGYLPRASSYPSTPKARGVSTLLRALSDVPVPPAVFISPFPADRRQQSRRQFGGSQPNEDHIEEGDENQAAENEEEEGEDESNFQTARQVLQYDESGDEDESERKESDSSVSAAFKNPYKSASNAAQQIESGLSKAASTASNGVKKMLRPTAAQAEAERATAQNPKSQSRVQQDTPTVSRARSRLNAQDRADSASSLNRKIGINEEDRTSSSNSRLTRKSGSSASSASTASTASPPNSQSDDQEEQEEKESLSSRSTSSSSVSSASTDLPSQLSQSKLFQEARARTGGIPTHRKKSGLIATKDSTVPFTVAGLLLLALAQVLAMQESVRRVPERDVLGLEGEVARVESFLNGHVATGVKMLAAAVPMLASYLPSKGFDLVSLIQLGDWTWLLVPALYLLAAWVIKKGYELTDRDLHSLTPAHSVDHIERAHARHAHHVFIACGLFVTSLSFWVFYLASQTFVAPTVAATVAAVPGQAATAAATATVTRVVFSYTWAAGFLVLTSLAWALTETTVWSGAFSTTHQTFWLIALVLVELTYWRAFPTSLLAYAPFGLGKLYHLGIAYVPTAFTVPASTAPLIAMVIVHAAEGLKGAAGLFHVLIGRALLCAVPLVYLYGLTFLFHSLVDVTGAPWLESLLVVAGLGALSVWEVVRYTKHLQVERSE